MLSRSRAMVPQKISDAELLDKLRVSPMGQQFQMERQQTAIDRRTQSAAALATATQAADEEIRRLDAEQSVVDGVVKDLADRLVKAQERKGEIVRERTAVEQRRHDAVRKAMRVLEATAPAELIELAELAKFCQHSARFQIKLRRSTPTTIASIDFDPGSAALAADAEKRERVKRNAALLKRAQEVSAKCNEMFFRPHVDLEEIHRLHVFLDTPKELIEANLPGVNVGDQS